MFVGMRDRGGMGGGCDGAWWTFLTHGLCQLPLFNRLKPGQNGLHFTDDILKCIFLNENVWILIKISLKFVAQGPISNIRTLVQMMTWRRPGDKPLSGPLMVKLPTHICVIRPEWVNVYAEHFHWLIWIHIRIWYYYTTAPLTGPANLIMLPYI